MDLVRPLPVTPAGNKYLITITDYYTKWAVAGALKDKSASSVAEFLYMVYKAVVHLAFVCQQLCKLNATLPFKNTTSFLTLHACMGDCNCHYILSRCSVLTVLVHVYRPMA